jgi:hypothetical protein
LLFRRVVYKQVFRPPSPRTAVFVRRFALHTPASALRNAAGILNEKSIFAQRDRALGAASAQEALQRSGTRLRAQQPPIFSAFAARPALCLAKMRGFPAAGLPRALFSSLLFLQA